MDKCNKKNRKVLDSNSMMVRQAIQCWFFLWNIITKMLHSTIIVIEDPRQACFLSPSLPTRTYMNVMIYKCNDTLKSSSGICIHHTHFLWVPQGLFLHWVKLLGISNQNNKICHKNLQCKSRHVIRYSMILMFPLLLRFHIVIINLHLWYNR